MQQELRWVDSGVTELRADVCQVQSTRTEAALLFGTQQPSAADGERRARLERRVVMSPALAKQLALGLAAVLREQAARDGGNATPAGVIRSAAREEDAPAAARPLLRLVQELGVGFGFEKSFKLAPGGAQAERLILGVRTALAGEAALLGVCRGIGMPQDYLEEFARRLPQANTAGFGFEGDGAGGAYKVYLEFWDALRDRVQREPRDVSPALLFLGFKWDPRDAGRRAIARYTCHPLLSVEGIGARLGALYEGGAGASLEAARAILALAARRLGPGTFVYVEAAEEGNPRRSFDLNFYKAGLRVADLLPALEPLCARYGIGGDALGALAAQAGAHPFGHLSGGLGRDGRDFLTVYYELEGL